MSTLVARTPALPSATRDAQDGAEERDLCARVQAGDRAAFDGLVRRLERPIFHLMLRHVHDEEEARDLAQRAFLRAFEQAGRFRGESSPRTWIYRIAINLAHDAWRRPPLPLPVAAPASEAPAHGERLLMQAQAAQRLHAALAQLPPRQRLAVELRIFDDLSFREVAGVAGGSEDAAKVNFHHGLKRLRTLMAQGAEP